MQHNEGGGEIEREWGSVYVFLFNSPVMMPLSYLSSTAVLQHNSIV